MTKPDPWILLDEAEKRIKGYQVEKKLLHKRNDKLSKTNALLIEVLYEVDNFFNWGGFDIDFSNGNVCNGVDEGDVMGNKAWVALTEQIKNSLATHDIQE